MQIYFEFSGGYGGVFASKPSTLRIDTDELSENERDEFVNLVEASGLLDLVPDRDDKGQNRARDAFEYRLTIQSGNVSTTLTLDDATAPAAVHPLLAYLRKRAIDQRSTP